MYLSVKKPHALHSEPLDSNCTKKNVICQNYDIWCSCFCFRKDIFATKCLSPIPVSPSNNRLLLQGSSKLINRPTKIKKVFNFFLLDKELR